jgi:hypothetical protein
MYQDLWMSFSFMIESGPPLTGEKDADWFVIGGLHANLKSAVTQQLQFELRPPAASGDGEHFAIQVHGDNLVVDGLQRRDHVYYAYKSPDALQRGVWHSLVARVHLDEKANGDGAADIYLDGARVLNYRGSIGFAGDTPYLQLQLYRNNPDNRQHETVAVQYKNFRLTTDGTSLLWHAAPPGQ